MLAGTSGDFETKTVVPITEMNKMYDKITTPKVMARRVGMTHDDMMYKAVDMLWRGLCGICRAIRKRQKRLSVKIPKS